jgi:cytochrome c oxidase subunit IV
MNTHRSSRSHRSHRSGPAPPSLLSNLSVLAALLVLLGLSAGSALIPMGAFNEVANLGIAAVKALLVLIFFMRLKTDNPLLRLVAATGFTWLALLIGLSLADLLSRQNLLPPW